jgi:hypothetical protein
MRPYIQKRHACICALCDPFYEENMIERLFSEKPMIPAANNICTAGAHLAIVFETMYTQSRQQKKEDRGLCTGGAQAIRWLCRIYLYIFSQGEVFLGT